MNPREPTSVDAFPVLDEDTPFVDVPRMVAALRRRWRLWVFTSLAGLLAGLVLVVAAPAPYTATTSLMLAHPKASDASHEMENDVQLISSTTVARRAMARIGLTGSTADFAASYTPKNVSDSILQFSVTGRTAQDTVRRATAVATAFLEFRRAQLVQHARGVLAALSDRATQLQEQLSGIGGDQTSLYAGAADSGDVAGLLARQQALTTELGDIRRSMEETVDDTRSVVENSSVVDPPSATAPPSSKSAIRELGAALIVGWLLGAGVIVLQEMTTNRVRRRQDVMAALRAPVLVSTRPLDSLLGAGGRRRLGASAARRAQERTELARIVRHLHSELIPESATRQALLVVSIDSDAATALAAAVAAKELVIEGRSVLLVDFTRRSSLARRLGVPRSGTSEAAVEGGSIGVTCDPDEEDSGRRLRTTGVRSRRESSDVVMTIATLDPAQGADHLADWATSAVAVVTAGRSSSTVLRAAGQLLRGAGVELTSVILVGADPQDETVGLPDRSGPPPLDASSIRWANP